MKSKVLAGLFILISLAIGCVTEFNAKLPSGDEQILIVDGNIMEDTTVIIQLSKSYSMDSSYIPPEIFNIDAQVTLVGSNGYESSPATSLGKGKYALTTGTLDDNTEYGVKIIYNGDTYQSALSKPLSTPEIDSISWGQSEKYGPVSIYVSTHDNDMKDAKFFLWDYVEDWEFSEPYLTTIFLDPKTNSFYQDNSAPYFYCWRHHVSNEFLTGSTETLRENRIINKQLYQLDPSIDNRLSLLYCVTMNQKAISKSAYDYYENKIKLNEEMGGLFSPQPSDIDGNITCITDPSKRVMGYIEVTKNVTHKRMFIYSGQITRPPLNDECYSLSNDSVLTLLKKMNGTYADFYNLGYRPAGEPAPPSMEIPAEWAIASCTDCTQNAGSKNKPDFWPNSDN